MKYSCHAGRPEHRTFNNKYKMDTIVDTRAEKTGIADWVGSKDLGSILSLLLVAWGSTPAHQHNEYSYDT